MVVQRLEREKVEAKQSNEKNYKPALEGKEYIRERQLKPEARKDIIE